MKRTALILILLMGLAIAGCNKDDDNQPAPAPNATEVLPGTWRVSYYFDDEDETSDYTNYTFEFTAEGGLNAMTSSQTYQGSWQQTVDDNLPRLVMSLTGNEDLVELSDDWVIVSITGNEIKLRDDSSELEELRFVKIS